MIKRKTGYVKKNYNMFLFVIVWTIIVILSGLSIYELCVPNDITVYIACVYWLLFVLFTFVGSVHGTLKGKKEIRKKLLQIKKTNPYIYLRELPNDFGIGVASLLIDSTIENYKDIVAVILDLCARKYLNLRKQGDKYVITVLKDIDAGLLRNERYILQLLSTNDIKNIDYNLWYNFCMMDGQDLSLYCHEDVEVVDNDFLSEKSLKTRRIIRLIFSIFCGIITIIYNLHNKISIVWSILYGLGIFCMVLGCVSLFSVGVNFFLGLLSLAKRAKADSYANAMRNTLIKTDAGVIELQKLLSFEKFLADFGSFASKNPEEVILWDRYLSYAQLFGLTKKIMKSGYKQLVDNASFKIDDIDNINIDNMEVELS